MKKISFLMGALLLASSSLFTSCFCDNDDNSKTPDIVEERTKVYDFIYSSNLPAGSVEYRVVGETVEGNTVTIIATAKNGDYIEGNTIEKQVTLGDTRIIDVYFEFNEIPETVEVPVDDEDVTVYQGEDGSTLDEDFAFEKMVASVKTGANVYMPAEAIENALENGAENAFSVEVVLNNDTIKQVSAEDMKDVEAETAKKALETETVSFVCEPDGADFGDTPVTLTLTTSNSDGIEFYAVSEDPKNPNATSDRVEGVSTAEGHQIQVSHFSNWNLILVAQIKNYKETSTEVKGMKGVNAGENSISYNSIKSWTVDYPNTLVNAYLEGKLGRPAVANRNLTLPFTASADATVYYTVVTKTVEFDLVSGESIPFHVVAKLGSKVVIDRVEPGNSGHSGGSAQ